MKKFHHFLVMLLLTAGIITSCTKKDDDPDQGSTDNTLIGIISKPLTLTADKTWYIEGDVYVETEMIILPGTTIKCKPGSSISFGYSQYASLTAVGTLEKPIIFTSSALLPAKADWKGIFFYDSNSSSSSLTFVTVEYAGKSDYAAINVIRTSLNVNSCTIRKNAASAISLDYEQSKLNSFTLNNISDNEEHAIICYGDAASIVSIGNIITTKQGFGILVQASTITKNATWSYTSVPYIISGELYIQATGGAVLNITEGVKIAFTPGSSIYIGYSGFGTLNASGSLLNPIIFTSNAVNPSAGDWSGIKFYDDASNGCKIDYCNVSYAGKDSDGAIKLIRCGSKVTISNSSISNSENWGIYSDNQSSPILTNITYLNNNLGEYYQSE